MPAAVSSSSRTPGSTVASIVGDERSTRVKIHLPGARWLLAPTLLLASALGAAAQGTINQGTAIIPVMNVSP
jgi:hypothetical protein